MKKQPRAIDLAAKEGVTCHDCIWEALRYAGIWPIEGPQQRVPRSHKYGFLAALLLEDLNHRRETE